jgi:two-component system CheB/CheR fusion protein
VPPPAETLETDLASDEPDVTEGDRRRNEERSFPVVGIGASAGGLEALEQFLRHVPDRSGMAFVVIQHLDPTHKGTMVELLQRATRMNVLQAADLLQVEPDKVYVIPPGKDMSILHGVLHLLPQQMPRGLNLPIDFFFRSLAEDQQERSIGVVLSGMGSDGTLGLRAIKEKAGVGFAQSLTSAKFDGMPRSAIDAGLADVVAPVEELPGKIIAYREHAPYIAQPHAETLEEKALPALEKVFILLRAQTGNDFSLYKKSTIHRRIARRMGLHQIDKINNYVHYLRENTREIELLFRELLIGVTSFFRDPAAWDFLRNNSLSALLASRPSGTVIRAWVPGCSTGEEAYSLAMVFREALEALKAPKNLTLQVFATDLDRDAIEKARLGVYPANIVADVSAERLRRFFVEEERGYRVGKEIREMVVFAPQNIIMDPPFTRLDILSCRNLLIYLAPELQKKLIPLFHYSLNPGGILFLGSAETVGTFTGLFVPADGKQRVYRKLEAGTGAAPIEFPAAFLSKAAREGEVPPLHAAGPPASPNLQVLADHVLVQRFSPAAVLTSDKGDILYISGRTGKYLEPAVGRASMNLFAMAREGLRLDLSTAFAAALREDRPITVDGVRVGTNGGTQQVNLTVQRLTEPKELRGTVMVVIADATDHPREAPKIGPRKSAISDQLEKELQRAHEEVQTTREEMQTSQEELKSTNEELQSTNEELQSTNEELTTSKEEMQSMNEELQTVNHELQSKVDELSRSNNDMKNLLNSTDIATLFLDGHLLVRRFTSPIAELIKLIPSDVGRPISDIAREIDYPQLTEDAREVTRTLVFKERLVPGADGRWFSVRIMPYRTIENVIDGVVITFTDASVRKDMEGQLTQQASELRQMAESLPNLVFGCRRDGACDYVGAQWVKYTGVPESELLGVGWLHTVHDDERERARQLWRAAIKGGTPLDLEIRIRGKDALYRWFKLRAVPIHEADGNLVKWYSTATDVDDLKTEADRRQAAADRATNILEHVTDPFFALNEAHKIDSLNYAARQLVGEPDGAIGKSLFEVLPGSDSRQFRETFQKVLKDGRVVSFETELQNAPQRERFTVRLFPHLGSIGALLQRNVERATGRNETPRSQKG